MLTGSSSPRSDAGLDFDFFRSGSRITDTGTTSATRHAEHPDDERNVALECTVTVGTKEIKLMRDPMAGTGGLLWPAGQVLAEYLTRQGGLHPDLFHDKRVMELGSGTGIVGLSLVMNLDFRRGAMVLTDLAKVVPILHANLRLNGSPDAVQVRELEWGKAIDRDLLDCDVILLADCIYLEALFLPLIHTLIQVMRDKGGTVGYLSYKKRRKADARFFKQWKKHFVVEELEVESQRLRKDNIHLYKFWRKAERSSVSPYM